MLDQSALDQSLVQLNTTMQLVLGLILMLIMYSVSLGLRPADFHLVLQEPKKVLIGMVAQVILLPLITLFLILTLKPAPSISLGMIVVASCPGGNVSNFYAQQAKGNVALSVTLTALSSAISVVILPISILFWSSFYQPLAQLIDQIALNRWAFIAQTFVMLALPLALGMWHGSKWPQRAYRWQRLLKPFSFLSLIVIIIFGIMDNWDVFLAFGHVLVPISIIHNMSAFLMAALVGGILMAHKADRRTLTFEVGLQNAGLGLIIILSQFQGLSGAAHLSAIWGIWHLVGGMLVLITYKIVDRLAGK